MGAGNGGGGNDLGRGDSNQRVELRKEEKTCKSSLDLSILKFVRTFPF